MRTIRIFNIYCSTRVLLFVCCEMLLVFAAFIVAACGFPRTGVPYLLMGQAYLARICWVAVLTFILSYYFDLFEHERLVGRKEIYFRLLLVLGVLSMALAAAEWLVADFAFGQNVLASGVLLLTVLLFAWFRIYEWLMSLSLFKERVYVLGDGPRAQDIVLALKSKRFAAMEVVSGDPAVCAATAAERYAADLRYFAQARKPLVDRVVVAMEDRRDSMPVRELLDLRLKGAVVEDANTLIERLSGKLLLNGLTPSSLIFFDGFNVKASFQLTRRLISILISLTALILCLPLFPILMVAVRLSSPGPVFFSQTRVGKHGKLINIYKFRTMRQDAEAEGAVWATKNDPRVTPLGRFMRKTRLDEIPQLWNVLKGDMAFIGPRPERPEFVEWLTRELPFYELRHSVRPGLTGWAQVRYQYGASLEETRNKLEFDLYALKHQSLGLDLLILFETVKTILLRRGAQ